MTTTPGEVAGLPTGGPATLPAVNDWLGRPTEEANAKMDMVIAAVNPMVRKLPIAEASVIETEAEDPEDDPTLSWSGNIVLAAVMLCSALERRSTTPDGVAALSDLTPVYVMRNDPDVARLLQLGPYETVAAG